MIRPHTEALEMLREMTCTPANRDIFSVLIRAAVMSPAAADVLIRSDLRTKGDRRLAITKAAAAMAAELDEIEELSLSTPTPNGQ
jgi:hypothetical protein